MPPPDDDDLNPPQLPNRTGHVLLTLAGIDSITGKVYTDPTGGFPHASASSCKCVLIACDVDSNNMLAKPMKSRNDVEALCVHKVIYDKLSKSGFPPKLNVMDNEASTAVKRQIIKSGADCQPVEPRNHHVNAAERAIRTQKNHLSLDCVPQIQNFQSDNWTN